MARAGVIFDYQGLTADEINDLRQTLAEKNLKMRVYKNTLFRIALKELQLGVREKNQGQEKELFHGPSAVIFSPEEEDPISAAKALVDWKKSAEKKDLKIKGGFFAEDLLSPEEVEQYAALPSKEVLLAQFLGAVSAPVQSFVRVLDGPMREFLLVLKAIEEKREKEE